MTFVEVMYVDGSKSHLRAGVDLVRVEVIRNVIKDQF